jgi:hypothetical protein
VKGKSIPFIENAAKNIHMKIAQAFLPIQASPIELRTN